TDEALIEQLRAAGRSAEADAKSLSEQVADLSQEQKAADDAAERLARGQASSPLAAASQQQQVADKADEIAQRSPQERLPQEIARPLQEAGKSAAAAARETLGGAPAKAEQAREQTRTAIGRTEQAAKQLAQQVAQSQPANPDEAAQSKAAATASEAQRLADAAEK